MKKFFGFGSSTPPPPAPPAKPPSPPTRPAAPAPAAPAPAPVKAATPAAAPKPAPAREPAAAPKPSIVGKWKEPNGSDTTEFHAEGTVTERLASGETIRGRYSLAESKLTINLDGLADELTFSALIKTDTLEMTGPDGQVTRYQRA